MRVYLFIYFMLTGAQLWNHDLRKISLFLAFPAMSSMVKPIVIEISSSSEDEETKRNWSEAEKGRRRRYSDVEVKTEVKRMEEEEEEEEDCCILPFDPLADDLNRKLSLCGAQPQIDDLSIVAERGQVLLPSLRSFTPLLYSVLSYSSGE